jgi:hypothetical protein
MWLAKWVYRHHYGCREGNYSCFRPQQKCSLLEIMAACSFGWWLVDDAGLFWDKSNAGWCWNLVHVDHLVNSKACTIIVPYCQDKERLPCLNMGVSYHSKTDACERKGDCWYMHAQPAHFRVNYRVTCDLRRARCVRVQLAVKGAFFIFVLCQWRFSFNCLMVTVLLQSNRQFQPAW